METLIFEIIFIFFLILFNGFFSGAEIALVTLKKSRLRELLEDDRYKYRAHIIEKLQKDPDRFFATVQIGVTLLGALASAFGGQRLVPWLAPLIELIPVPGIAALSVEIALIFIVLSITYVSLILGELVPKSLAINNSESFSLFVAYPLHFFSKMFAGFTVILTFSSNLILRFFKDRTSFSESRNVTGELLHLIDEGLRSGHIKEGEHEIIENAIEFNETTAREVMVPRVDVVAVAIDASEQDKKRILDNTYSRLPVFQESLDHIVGILHIKDLIRHYAKGGSGMDLSSLLRPAFFVPESMRIVLILREMQKRKLHMAVVVDEFGGTSGILTMEDILEEIVGDIQDVTEQPDDMEIVPNEDGSFMVSGSCYISDFNEYFDLDIPETDAYTSVAGFVLHELGRFPDIGEKTEGPGADFYLEKRVRQKMELFRVIINKKESAENEESNGNHSSEKTD